MSSGSLNNESGPRHIKTWIKSVWLNQTRLTYWLCRAYIICISEHPSNMRRKVIATLAYYAAPASARDNECWRHHAKTLRHTINQDAKGYWS